VNDKDIVVNVVREEPAPCRLKLDIEVPAEAVKSVQALVEGEFRKQARVPGFRPGKTPRPLLWRHYGEKIREEVKDRLVRLGVRRALEQEKLTPETYPVLDNEEALTVSDTESFVFSVQFDMAPQFALPDYKQVKVEDAPVEVKEDQVEDVIKGMLERLTSFAKIERAAVQGDLLKASYHGRLADESVAVPEAAKYLLAAEQTWIALREPEIIPGVIGALAGAEAGSRHVHTTTFPADFYDRAIAGQTVTYTIEVHEVHAPNVPELDDATAKRLGAENADGARRRVRESLESRQQAARDRARRDQVVGQLLEKVDFGVPPALLARETYDILTQLYQNDVRRGAVPEGDAGKEHIQQLRGQAESYARQRLRRHYLLTRIAEAEGIKVEPAEIQATLETMSAAHNLSLKALQRRLQESGRLGDLIDGLLDDKTLNRLLEFAGGAPAAPDGQPAPTAQA